MKAVILLLEFNDCKQGEVHWAELFPTRVFCCTVENPSLSFWLRKCCIVFCLYLNDPCLHVKPRRYPSCKLGEENWWKSLHFERISSPWSLLGSNLRLQSLSQMLQGLLGKRCTSFSSLHSSIATGEWQASKRKQQWIVNPSFGGDIPDFVLESLLWLSE